MFEGSENIPRGKIDKYVSAAGGNLNASTSFDQTDYFFNLPSNELKLALWIESERMMHAKVDEVGVETQRKVVKEEKRMRYDNQPYGSLFEELAKFVFAGTPYSWVPIGSVQYIDQATIGEFRDFYKTYYLPNNATLAIAGDFDVESTKKLVEEYFGPIPKGPDIQRPKVTLPNPTAPSTHDVVKENTPLNATMHSWHAVPETHPDAYALQLLGNIPATGAQLATLQTPGGKGTGRAQRGNWILSLEDAGCSSFRDRPARAESRSIDKLIDEEVERVGVEGVTEEEFRKALNQEEAEFASGFGTMQFTRGNWRGITSFTETPISSIPSLTGFFAVKREDIQRVAKQYLAKDGVYVLRYPVPSYAGHGGTFPRSDEKVSLPPGRQHSSRPSPTSIARNNRKPIRRPRFRFPITALKRCPMA